MPPLIHTLGVPVLFALVGCASPTPARSEAFVFTDDAGRRYNALIESPPPARDTGVSVMLLGGGSVTDLDWTVPGEFTPPSGPTTRLTIDGRPTRDARTISTLLTDAGFRVLRYSSIHTDDPMLRTPGAATPLTYEQALDVARAARNAFAERHAYRPGRLVLLGHSLGATRAAHLAAEDPDHEVCALVFLAGAYLSWTPASPSATTRAALERVWAPDRCGLDAHNATLPEGLTAHDDLDADGRLRGWEIAGALAMDGFDPSLRGAPFRSTLAWVPDVLIAQNLPTLGVFGGLDPISIHGAHLETLARDEALDLRVVYIAGRGHQLGAEEGDLVGPIDPVAVELVRDWLIERIARRPRGHAR